MKSMKRPLFYSKCFYISFFQIFNFLGSSVIFLSLSEIPIWTHQRQFVLRSYRSITVFGMRKYLAHICEVHCRLPILLSNQSKNMNTGASFFMSKPSLLANFVTFLGKAGAWRSRVIVTCELKYHHRQIWSGITEPFSRCSAIGGSGGRWVPIGCSLLWSRTTAAIANQTRNGQQRAAVDYTEVWAGGIHLHHFWRLCRLCTACNDAAKTTAELRQIFGRLRFRSFRCEDNFFP